MGLKNIPGRNTNRKLSMTPNLIEYSTEKYDHKRGFCTTLTAQVEVPCGKFYGSQSVSSPAGKFQ